MNNTTMCSVEKMTNWSVRSNFEQLQVVLQKNLAFCPWVREKDCIFYLGEIKKEIEELEERLQNGTKKEIIEEMGDVLYDGLMMVLLAEKKYDVKMETFFKNIIEKLKRRKPYIFESKSVALEEAERFWQEAKRKEKEAKSTNHD